MSLLDQLAEKHILAALRQGELDNLPGSGRTLQLDDDSHIPVELRAGYRILKNSGFLPPELEMRREAIELHELLRTVDSEEDCYQQQEKQLRLLEMKLKQAGSVRIFYTADMAEKCNGTSVRNSNVSYWATGETG